MKQLNYTLSSEFLEKSGRSLTCLIWDRLGADGKRVYRSYIGLTFDDARGIARETCGDDPTFISPKMPVVEIIFRLLLVAPTDIVPADRLHQMLGNVLAPSQKRISYDLMVRLLSSATSYGIVALQVEDDRNR